VVVVVAAVATAMLVIAKVREGCDTGSGSDDVKRQ